MRSKLGCTSCGLYYFSRTTFCRSIPHFIFIFELCVSVSYLFVCRLCTATARGMGVVLPLDPGSAKIFVVATSVQEKCPAPPKVGFLWLGHVSVQLKNVAAYLTEHLFGK